MSRFMMCSECGRRMKRFLNDWGVWDGETYYCENCALAAEQIDSDEVISVYDAASIWDSHGRDEDYTFGYSEEDLEEALNE